jgi:hypothetical protein
MTVDQRGSRRGRDLVDEAGQLLTERIGRPRRGFERTAGDEFQGVLDDATQVVDACLLLVRHGSWSIGIGVGPVEEPLPQSTRAGRGPAFVHARAALTSAKRQPQHLGVAGPNARAHDAQVVLTLLAAVTERRTDAGWEAVDLVAAGRTLSEAATVLGVTRQAVGQRLSVALWHAEVDARPLAARLLEEAAA